MIESILFLFAGQVERNPFTIAAPQPFTIRQAPKVVTTWESWRVYKPTGLSQRIVRYVDTGPAIKFWHLDQDDFGTTNVNRVFPWLVPGGLHNLQGWRSELRMHLPPESKIKVWTEDGQITGAGVLPRKQWAFPVGTKFADVLFSGPDIFEARVREKVSETQWRSDVMFRDEDKAPKGYKGPGKACVECHSKAGMSIAAGPLLRGGDQSFSPPIPEILAGTLKSDDWPLEVVK